MNVRVPVDLIFPIVLPVSIPSAEPRPSVDADPVVKAPAPVIAFVPVFNVPLTVSVLLVATGRLLASVNDAPLLTVQLIVVFVRVPAD